MRQRQNIYIALEDIDFIWDEADLEKIRELWEGGIHIRDMASYLKRKPVEVFCLLLDQSSKGMIKKRKGDLYGCLDQIKGRSENAG
jgi:hypothetical protein